ncbi:hypothetical protein BC830DRAFT_584932 [Chytriomyces sp. MP71]|nr:hypothetical protein BC830DRAFT_584932 [Chytriomyces sp. MP71]
MRRGCRRSREWQRDRRRALRPCLLFDIRVQCWYRLLWYCAHGSGQCWPFLAPDTPAIGVGVSHFLLPVNQYGATRCHRHYNRWRRARLSWLCSVHLSNKILKSRPLPLPTRRPLLPMVPTHEYVDSTVWPASKGRVHVPIARFPLFWCVRTNPERARFFSAIKSACPRISKLWLTPPAARHNPQAHNSIRDTIVP